MYRDVSENALVKVAAVLFLSFMAGVIIYACMGAVPAQKCEPVSATSVWLTLLALGRRLSCSQKSDEKSISGEGEVQEKKEQKVEAETVPPEAEADRVALVRDLEMSVLRVEQLEQEMEQMRHDFSDMASSLIHKDELLCEILVKLDEISELPGSDSGRSAVSRQLARLRQIIERNIGQEKDDVEIAGNVDAVYAGFTRKLVARHPNLSESDRRLCRYILMGLSSKEIAPLVNVSYKSVEMARYRVRKKIGLGSGDSLANYLMKL